MRIIKINININNYTKTEWTQDEEETRKRTHWLQDENSIKNSTQVSTLVPNYATSFGHHIWHCSSELSTLSHSKFIMELY